MNSFLKMSAKGFKIAKGNLKSSHYKRKKSVTTYAGVC